MEIIGLAWYYSLAIKIGSVRPIDVRRAIEGAGAGLTKDGQPDKNQKYSQYKAGTRCPSASLVAKAEDRIPGSSLMFHHPLWVVSHHEGPFETVAIAQAKRLSSKVRDLILSRDGKRIVLTPIGLNGLEQIASLDSLAGLLIFFRLAHERNESRLLWDCATAIFRVMIVLGPYLSSLRIAEKFFTLLCQRFLHLAVHDGYGRVWSGFDYVGHYERFYKAIGESLQHRKRGPFEALVPRRLDLILKNQDFLPLMYPHLALGPPTQRGAELMEAYNNAIEGEACQNRKAG